MARTIEYFIVVARNGDHYIASSLAFPDIAITSTSARIAYARLKQRLKSRLLALISNGQAIPRDPVVQTTTLRIDLWYLRQQEELQ